MTDITHNPHDKLFKDTFTRKESLISFVQACLPDSIAALINSDSAKPYRGTFVDSHLKEYYSDIVYKFELNGRSAFLYLLVDLNQPGNWIHVDDLRCRFVLHLMRAAATGTLLKAFEDHGSVLAALYKALAEEDSLGFFETICRYAMNVDDAIDVDSLRQVIEDSVNKEAGDTVMSLAEKLEAKGQAEILQTLLSQKFPDAPPVNLEDLPLADLETIAKRILTCNTLEEVFQGIPDMR